MSIESHEPAPQLDEWGLVDGRRPTVAEAEAAFEALGRDAGTPAGSDAYCALRQAEHDLEAAAHREALTSEVTDRRRERGDDASLRAELVQHVHDSAQTSHELGLQFGGDEGWWGEDAHHAREVLDELDRQLRPIEEEHDVAEADEPEVDDEEPEA